jgi:RimJ/RimL family protein N-acetyltransferase
MSAHKPKPSIILRAVALDDAPAITRLLEGDSDLALKTATIPIPYHLEHAYTFLREADPERVFAIVSGSELVGVIGMMPAGESTEIGYWIGRGYWRRGYATRAIALLIEKAHGRGVYTLTADVFPNNPASMRALEKNGFVQVGNIHRDLPHRGGLRRLIRFQLELSKKSR